MPMLAMSKVITRTEGRQPQTSGRVDTVFGGVFERGGLPVDRPAPWSSGSCHWWIAIPTETESSGRRRTKISVGATTGSGAMMPNTAHCCANR